MSYRHCPVSPVVEIAGLAETDVVAKLYLTTGRICSGLTIITSRFFNVLSLKKLPIIQIERTLTINQV